MNQPEIAVNNNDEETNANYESREMRLKKALSTSEITMKKKEEEHI